MPQGEMRSGMGAWPAGDGELQHVLGDEDIVLEQRALHLLALAGMGTLHQRRHAPTAPKTPP